MRHAALLHALIVSAAIARYFPLPAANVMIIFFLMHKRRFFCNQLNTMAV